MAAAIPTPDRPGIVGRMAANAVAQIVGIPLQSLLSLATFAAITRYLGPSVFGDYVAAMAYLFLPTVIADIGISTIVLRDISTEPERMDAIVRAATAFRSPSPPSRLVQASASRTRFRSTTGRRWRSSSARAGRSSRC